MHTTMTPHEELDHIVERGLARRWGLRRTLQELLPRLCALAGAQAACVRTTHEDLQQETVCWPTEALPSRATLDATLDAATGGESQLDGGVLLSQPLTVAEERVGSAALWFSAGLPPGAAALLHAASEELDGILFLLREARRRHDLTVSIGEALQRRVLADGLHAAASLLLRDSGFSGLAVRYQVSPEQAPQNVAWLQRGERIEEQVLACAPEEALRASLPGASLYARPLSAGGKAGVAGHLIAASMEGAPSVSARELVESVALLLSQRLSDLGQEWRRLASSFSARDVSRLLDEPDYEARYLAPLEREVAILYADIAGFTRISEQRLQTPERVGALIEAWSQEVVRLVWEHGGVFDKMVGDCVIALFGPPFYEEEPAERLARALRCALAIREVTRAFPAREGFAHLREEPLGVATGVHLAPLFVGSFGPNRNFTGFSSGMNNTARLQGCATRDEILVMEEAIPRLPPGHAFHFGEPRHSKVKNVASPLQYRALAG